MQHGTATAQPTDDTLQLAGAPAPEASSAPAPAPAASWDAIVVDSGAALKDCSVCVSERATCREVCGIPAADDCLEACDSAYTLCGGGCVVGPPARPGSG